MGIQGLLSIFRDIMDPIHISEFSGKVCAIDAYVWLHKDLSYCGDQLLLNESDACDDYIKRFMKRLLLLKKYNIKPIVVFDGKALPAKSETQGSRRMSRAEKLNMAEEAKKQGNFAKAKTLYCQAANVTFRMVSNLIRVLKHGDIQYVVAPFEADAQLAWLARNNLVDFIITEDSDLIIYECPLIVFKFDDDGNGELFKLSDIQKAKNTFVTSVYMLRQACIIAGCDYYEGLKGLGVKKASDLVIRHPTIHSAIHQFVKDDTATKTSNSSSTLEPILSVEEILNKIHRAESTFLYQVIFDTRMSRCDHLRPLPKDLREEDIQFAGFLHASPILAKLYASGVIDSLSERIYCYEDYEYLCKEEKDFLSKEMKSVVGEHTQKAQVWYRDADCYETNPIVVNSNNEVKTIEECDDEFGMTLVLNNTMRECQKKRRLKFDKRGEDVGFIHKVRPSTYKKRVVKYMADDDDDLDFDKIPN